MCNTRKLKITYLADEHSPFPKWDAKILSKDYDVTTINLNLHEKNYFKFLCIGLSRLLLSILNTDLSITWTVDIHTAYVVLISKIFRKKSIVIVGGYEVCNMPEINYGLQINPVRGWIAQWALKNANAVLVPSVAYQQKVKELVGVTAYVLPNCSEIPNVSPIEQKLPVVVMIAGQYGSAEDFSALKGILTYDAIAKAMPETAFFLIGTADKQLRNRCNSIHFTGKLKNEEVQDLLSKSKVYCQLSYTESFGVALLEAIQFGCVPVVTDKDGMTELVGNSGYKIKYGDVESGTFAVKQALLDNTDRSETISNGRNKYNKEQRRAGFMNVINVVVGKNDR